MLGLERAECESLRLVCTIRYQFELFSCSA